MNLIQGWIWMQRLHEQEAAIWRDIVSGDCVGTQYEPALKQHAREDVIEVHRHL